MELQREVLFSVTTENCSFFIDSVVLKNFDEAHENKPSFIHVNVSERICR